MKFSEAVTGFDASDVTVTNDTLSSFSGSDTSYTFNLTPTAEGAVTVDISANAAQDAAGNGNTAATQFSIIFDNSINPATVITSTAASPIKTAAIPISVSFSDKVTGFASSDLTVTNGSVTSLSGSGKTYSVTVTAAAQGLVTVIVPDSVAQDAAGYYNTASTQFNMVYSQKDNAFSLSFDGTNDRLKIPDSSALDFTGNFTIEAWVKVNGSDQSGQIMYRENPNQSSDPVWRLYVDGGKYKFQVRTTSNNNRTMDSGVSADGDWHHIAAVRDDEAMRLYVDGVEKKYETTVAGDLVTEAYIWIGVDGKVIPLTDWLQANIDEVRLWNVARTADQIKDNYWKNINASQVSGLVGYWQFNSGSGSVTVDQTTNATKGEVSGAIWSSDVPLKPPIGLTAAGTDGKITLRWNSTSGANISKYRIYRDTSSPAGTLTDSVTNAPPDTFYVDSNVSNGTTYYYRITSVDSDGNVSNYSDEVSATPRGLKYVATTGNNSNNGTSSSPYKTIQYAIDNTT
ncbi:MAG: Ig-like domain-containing protein, partial [Gammaproteobacteria bacterium]|nr:Ig-like domain-containing protein [Gammaproteobacteria bacterium]